MLKNLNLITAEDKAAIFDKVYAKFEERSLDTSNIMNVDPCQRCTPTELRIFINEQGYDSHPIDSYPMFVGYITKCLKRFKNTTSRRAHKKEVK